MKFLIKLFMPSATTLSEYAAKAIQKAVNDSGKNEQIAKYGTTADQIAEIAKKLTDMAKDGKLDDLETDELATMVKPIFEGIVKLI